MLTQSESIRAKAYELYEARKLREAIAECLKGITVCPVVVWPYLLAGKCHFALNETRAARGHLSRFLELVRPSLSTQASISEAKRILATLEGIE